eukprot:192645-Rhodomonas_salina.2
MPAFASFVSPGPTTDANGQSCVDSASVYDSSLFGCNEGDQEVTFSVSHVSGDNLLLAAPVLFPNGTLSFCIVPDSCGEAECSALFSVVLSDDGDSEAGGSNRSEAVSFRLFVEAVNTPPSFDLTSSVVEVYEDSGLQVRDGFAFNISSGPPSESAQQLTFFVSNDASLFSEVPSISTDG